MTGTKVLRTHKFLPIDKKVKVASQSQVLTNVPRVHQLKVDDDLMKITDHRLTNGKKISHKIRATFDLVYDPKDKHNPPFFVVHYHAHSDLHEIREEELIRINQQIRAFSDAIQQAHDIEINDYVVMGDFNENVLKSTTTLDKDNLKFIIGGLGEGARLIDFTLPEGLMSKWRGILTRAYNLFINPQARKEKKQNLNDSKDCIFYFSLLPQEDQPQEECEIDSLLKRKENEIKARPLLHKNFLKENTDFRDHFKARPFKRGNIILSVGSLLPTDGLKGIKNPEEIYKPEWLERNNLGKRRQIQEKATVALFELLVAEFDPLLIDLPADLKDYDHINANLDLLNEAMAKDEKSEEDIAQGLANVLNAWIETKEHKNVLNMLLPKKAESVSKKLGELAEDMQAKVVVKDKSKGDIIGKFIQVIAQTESQELTGGYAEINSYDLPGIERVDRAQASSSAHQIDITDPDNYYYYVDTEATPDEATNSKSKSDFFETEVNNRITALPFDEWKRELKQYLRDRHLKYFLKDLVSPDDARLREERIKILIQALDDYCSILQQLRNSEEEVDPVPAQQYWVDTLVNINHKIKKDFPGHNLTKLIDVISYQLLFHVASKHPTYVQEHEEIPDKFFESMFDTEVLKNEEQQRAQCLTDLDSFDPSAMIEWVKTSMQQIEILNKHVKASFKAGKERNAQLQVCKEMTETIFAFLDPLLEEDQTTFRNPTRAEFKKFKAEFSAIAHSQDALMSHHRSCFSFVANMIIGLLTAGIAHLIKGAVTKCTTGVAEFSFFSETKRMTLLDNIEEQVLDQSICIN